MRIRTGLLLSIGLLVILQAQVIRAQDISANATLDTTAMRIGEQMGYTITLTGRGDFEATFPEKPDTLTAGIEVISEKPAEKEKEGNITRISKQYRITGFEQGGYAIPQFEVQVTQNGQQELVAANSVFLQINSVPLDTAQKDIYDVKAPLEAPLTVKEFIVRFYPYIIGVLVVAVLLWYLLVFRKKHHTERPLVRRKPLEPPHVEAMEALNALEARKLWQKDKLKAYYTELTGILRHYIYRRFGVPTMERTSAEILASLRNRNDLPHAHYEALHYILETADFVKFAREKTTPDENRQCMNHAKDFVQATEPEPAVQEGNNEEHSDKTATS